MRKYFIELTQEELDMIRTGVRLVQIDAEDSADLSPELEITFKEHALKAMLLVKKLNQMERGE